MKEEAMKLIEMFRKRVSDREIVEKLGVQTKASLKKMYYEALVETGKIKDIVTKQGVEKKKTLRVTKRGTVLLNKRLAMETFGFKEREVYRFQDKDGIILRREKG